MMKMPDDDHRIAAVLHDVVEDTPWTLQGLYVEGFSDTIIDAVEYLTHLEDEGYETYIGRMIGDAYLGFEGAKIALHVKLADLEDNMDVFHNMKFTTAGLKRYLKAVKAIKRTLDTVEGGDHV
jgi:(p)ppGpp synthase/HD superfamily hydrolase